MVRTIVAAVVALVLGLLIGFFVGRALLERQWSQPYARVTEAEEKRSSAGPDADPTPKAGTRVLGPMPIGRARLALAELTAKDPAVATVAAFGSGDEGIELHVVVENRAACTLSELAGVAYGFDAEGRPAKVNKAGESYVAFTHKGAIAPGKHDTVAASIRHGELATLAVAHIDRTTCTDGTAWARP